MNLDKANNSLSYEKICVLLFSFLFTNCPADSRNLAKFPNLESYRLKRVYTLEFSLEFSSGCSLLNFCSKTCLNLFDSIF